MKKQLLEDLADLEAAQVITADTASNIRGWYAHRDNTAPNRLGIILGILGALLIGSGLLLIIAHNWDDLGKLTKTVVSFIPLLIAQSLCLYVLLKQKDSQAWKECTAVLLFFAIPGSISLISQIYQVDGTLSGFLLAWILLALPLIYLMNSSVVALLSIGAATWYAVLIGYLNMLFEIPYLYLLMMLFIIPYYYQLAKRKVTSKIFLLMNVFGCISISIVLGTFIRNADGWYFLYFALYLILFCIFYFAGTFRPTEEYTPGNRPVNLLGLSGILLILFIWTFETLWKGFDYTHAENIFTSALPYLLLAGIGILCWQVKRKEIGNTDLVNHLAGFSFSVFLISLVFLDFFPSAGMLLINAWIFFIAVVYIRRGSAENDFGILNFGLIILGILAVCRFFDDAIPFVWRGIFFLVTGAAFFVANYLLLRKRKRLITKAR